MYDSTEVIKGKTFLFMIILSLVCGSDLGTRLDHPIPNTEYEVYMHIITACVHVVSCYDTSWSAVCPTPHHHDLVPREDGYQAVKTSSCYATDDIPGVSDWVVFVDVALMSSPPTASSCLLMMAHVDPDTGRSAVFCHTSASGGVIFDRTLLDGD